MKQTYKALLLIICILIGVGCVGPASSLPLKHRDSSRVITHINDSTVALVASLPGGMTIPFCTGVWVGPDKIMTASHCVEAAYKIALRLQGVEIDEESEETIDLEGTKVHYIVQSEANGIGSEAKAIHVGRAIKVDLLHDLAIIGVDVKTMPQHDSAALARELPGVGERVHIVGQVKGLYWSYIEGRVSAYRDTLPGNRVPSGYMGPFVQISGPVYYGNSGGGAFDEDGNLVGIASFMGGAPETSFFISATSCLRLLNETK